jgi:hypothetical protein
MAARFFAGGMGWMLRTIEAVGKILFAAKTILQRLLVPAKKMSQRRPYETPEFIW